MFSKVYGLLIMKTLPIFLISVFAMNAFSEPNFILISQEKVLHSNDDQKIYSLKFMDLKVFTDADERMIILTSYQEICIDPQKPVFDKDNEWVYKDKNMAIVGKDNKWVYSEYDATHFDGFVDKGGQFYLFTYKYPDYFAIYKLEDNLKFSSAPFWEAKVAFKKTFLKNENTTLYENGEIGVFRPIGQIFVVSEKPFKLYLSGQYEEKQEDLFSSIMNVTSGGHATFHCRPYVVSIDNNDLKMFPTDNDLKINETGSLVGTFTGSSFCFLKDVSQEYMPFTPQMDYYQFDISQEKWHHGTVFKLSSPLFKKLTSCGSSPLKFYDDKIFFAYSVSFENNLSDSGVYYCEKKIVNSTWEKPEKISETGGSPCIEIDSIGNVYAFWREPDGSLFYKCKGEGSWGEKHCLVKNFNPSPFYLFKFISDNKIGLVYTRYVDLRNYQLVYAEFVNEQNK